MFTGREFAEKSDNFYWRVIAKNRIDDSPENRLLFHRGFYLGAQYAMHTSGELSPHIARFLEFMMWLTDKEENESASD